MPAKVTTCPLERTRKFGHVDVLYLKKKMFFFLFTTKIQLKMTKILASTIFMMKHVGVKSKNTVAYRNQNS